MFGSLYVYRLQSCCASMQREHSSERAPAQIVLQLYCLLTSRIPRATSRQSFGPKSAHSCSALAAVFEQLLGLPHD